jgi:hypothetical protein
MTFQTFDEFGDRTHGDMLEVQPWLTLCNELSRKAS